MTVRQQLGDLLNEVRYRRGRIVIAKAGKPVAALVDIETLERLRKSGATVARSRGVDRRAATFDVPRRRMSTHCAQ